MNDNIRQIALDGLRQYGEQYIAWINGLGYPYMQLGWVLTAIALLLVLSRVLRALRAIGRVFIPARPKDGDRLFTSQQKNIGHARAGRRCELESFPGVRCGRPSAHGDHFFPWARGGATSMKNFVAACAHHNMKKGAKMPTAAERLRLEFRRRFYFPVGTPVTAGEWKRGR